MVGRSLKRKSTSRMAGLKDVWGSWDDGRDGEEDTADLQSRNSLDGARLPNITNCTNSQTSRSFVPIAQLHKQMNHRKISGLSFFFFFFF